MNDFPVSMAKQRAVQELLCTLRSGLTSDDEDESDEMYNGEKAVGIVTMRPQDVAGLGHAYAGGSGTDADLSSRVDHAAAAPPSDPSHPCIVGQAPCGLPPVEFGDCDDDSSSEGVFDGCDPSLPLPSPWRPAAAGRPLATPSSAVGRREPTIPRIGSTGVDAAHSVTLSPASASAAGARTTEIVRSAAVPVGPAAAAALALAARIRTRLAACLGEQLEAARLRRGETALSADMARIAATAFSTSRLEADAAAVASKKRAQSGRDAEVRAAQLAKKAASAASAASRLAVTIVEEATAARREAAAATAAAAAAKEVAAAAGRAVKEAEARVQVLGAELAELTADAGGDAPLQQIGTLVHIAPRPPAAGDALPSLVRVVSQRQRVSVCLYACPLPAIAVYAQLTQGRAASSDAASHEVRGAQITGAGIGQTLTFPGARVLLQARQEAGHEVARVPLPEMCDGDAPAPPTGGNCGAEMGAAPPPAGVSGGAEMLESVSAGLGLGLLLPDAQPSAVISGTSSSLLEVPAGSNTVDAAPAVPVSEPRTVAKSASAGSGLSPSRSPHSSPCIQALTDDLPICDTQHDGPSGGSNAGSANAGSGAAGYSSSGECSPAVAMPGDGNDMSQSMMPPPPLAPHSMPGQPGPAATAPSVHGRPLRPHLLPQPLHRRPSPWNPLQLGHDTRVFAPPQRKEPGYFAGVFPQASHYAMPGYSPQGPRHMMSGYSSQGPRHEMPGYSPQGPRHVMPGFLPQGPHHAMPGYSPQWPHHMMPGYSPQQGWHGAPMPQWFPRPFPPAPRHR